jgi:superfamily I DNA/RNA helicase
VPEGTNDLFLVGDAHQRIYGRPVVLGQCGINIRGRSYKLRINYRTTDEIRTWSLRVLTQQSVDDLDGGIDSTQGYMSLLSGEPPIVKECKTLVEEQSYLVERIKTLSKDAALETICLVARTNRQLVEDYLPAVNQASIPGVLLQADVPEQSEKGVRLATMHRVKGLEFAHVLMAGMNDGLMPLESARSDSEDMTCADSELQERCLFHVAATRARDTLSISCYGTPSRFINERPSS